MCLKNHPNRVGLPIKIGAEMPFGSLKQTVYLMPDAGANPIKVFYTYGQIKRLAPMHENNAFTQKTKDHNFVKMQYFSSQPRYSTFSKFYDPPFTLNLTMLFGYNGVTER